MSQVPIGNVTETVHKLLTERECGIFDKGLSTYHKRRDVSSLVECLALVLNTNRKRQLLVPIRDSFIKPSDVLKFNSLSIRHGLAAPLGGTGKKRERPFPGARKVNVKRTPTGEWGFNVRGGSEHATGVFVSWVEPMSNAHKAGLQIGDQIHKANDTNFDGITHFDATQVSLWTCNFTFNTKINPVPSETYAIVNLCMYSTLYTFLYEYSHLL